MVYKTCYLFYTRNVYILNTIFQKISKLQSSVFYGCKQQQMGEWERKSFCHKKGEPYQDRLKQEKGKEVKKGEKSLSCEYIMRILYRRNLRHTHTHKHTHSLSLKHALLHALALSFTCLLLNAKYVFTKVTNDRHVKREIVEVVKTKCWKKKGR